MKFILLITGWLLLNVYNMATYHIVLSFSLVIQDTSNEWDSFSLRRSHLSTHNFPVNCYQLLRLLRSYTFVRFSWSNEKSTVVTHSASAGNCRTRLSCKTIDPIDPIWNIWHTLSITTAPPRWVHSFSSRRSINRCRGYAWIITFPMWFPQLSTYELAIFAAR